MVNSPRGFEYLFRRNVPHILEKIFFSLNYDSFKTCSEVCRAWNELMRSDSYEERRIELIIEKIAMQKRAHRTFLSVKTCPPKWT